MLKQFFTSVVIMNIVLFSASGAYRWLQPEVTLADSPQNNASTNNSLAGEFSGKEVRGSSFLLSSESSQNLNHPVAESGVEYYANPLPPIPNDGSKEPLLPGPPPSGDKNRRGGDCYEYIVNSDFETDDGWFGDPLSNVDYSDSYQVSGSRSVYMNTNFYSNSAIWQPLSIPAEVDTITLSFWSGIVFPDPGEVVYITIYDDSFSELIYWDYLQYTIEGWNFFSIELSTEFLAGRDIQFAFYMVQDYDNFYSEVVLDDVSMALCSNGELGAPTPFIQSTSTSTPTALPPTGTPTSTPTLLPSNTPTATPITAATSVPGATTDLTIQRIQIGQAIMADADPVSGAPIPLIAEKPALVRAYVGVAGAVNVADVDATLFVRDAQGTVQTASSINGPITLTGSSTEGDARTTVNFLPNALWLNSAVAIWAEVDPGNLIAETNEQNNQSAEAIFTFQPGAKARIAWVEVNQGVNREIAQSGDSDLRKFYPVGINDVEYFFQPGFNQFINTPLTPQSYTVYFNALNRFWDSLTHEGSWVGGTPPDRMYGWAAGQTTGLCGVADAIWAGGRGRVATGYALQCAAETMAHELGHVLDNQGLRHSPNRPAQQDRNCAGEPAGPEPLYPGYPNLPLGSIGVTGFDATKQQLLFPNQTYDFMSYCEPSWASPFNYIRMLNGFGPTGATAASLQTDWATLGGTVGATERTGGDVESAKLLVSGIVYTGTVSAELDPFYVIRSSVPADESTGTDFCIELRDVGGTTLENRCFDLGFIHIESGKPTELDGFSMVVPYVQNTASVVLTRQGTDLASRAVSSSQPFIRLTNPTGGVTLSGRETITATWTASDLDGDTLFYALSYSSDDGINWLPLATDLTQTSYKVDLSQLPGSTQVKFRVGASDGINTAYDTSGGLQIGRAGNSTITVSGKAPTASIRTETTQIEPGRVLILEGSGYDLEDGLLPENALSWWSNRDGALGSGSWLQKSLSTGEHVISLKVTDSAGNTQIDTLEILVGIPIQNLFLPLVAQ